MNDRSLSILFPAFGLGLAVAVSNGFARFSYALVLPAMREQLAWDYAQSGWLNTANALGYIGGAISCYVLLRYFAAPRLFVAGMWLCFTSLGVTGLDSSLWWLSSTRVMSGVGAAWVFSCGGALVQQLYTERPTYRDIASGIYFGGAGIGIVFSGLVLSPFLEWQGAANWPRAWMVLGGLAVVFAIWPLRLAHGLVFSARSHMTASKDVLPYRKLASSLLAYFLYAWGYIIYMTFVIVWVREQRFDWVQATVVWVFLGVGISVSPFLWRRPLERWWPANTFAASCCTTLLGVGVLLLGSSSSMLLVSAFVYGLGLFIVPSAVLAIIRHSMDLSLLPRAMALFTSIFAVGQAIGPVVAGWVADIYGLDVALWMSIGLLALASVLPLLSRA